MRRARVFFAAVTLVIVVLTGRLLWIASHLEAGMETLGSMMRDGLLGWIGIEPFSLPDRPPQKQAQFWMDKTASILMDNPPDPELLLGAAWILDSPSQDYLSNHVDWNAVRTTPTRPPVLNVKEIASAEEQFEAICNARCMHFAELATTHDAANVLYWRSRALLVSKGSTHFATQPLRISDPLPLWKECAKHDPSNALYDYLAARHISGSACHIDYPEDKNETLLVVDDADLFAKCLRHLDQALQKPLFAIGEGALPAMNEILAASGLSLDSQVRIALSRSVNIRRSSMLLELWRLQSARMDDQLRRDDLSKALAIGRQQLQMLSHGNLPDEFWRFDNVVLSLTRSTLERLDEIAHDHPQLVTANEQLHWTSVRQDLEKRAEQLNAMDWIRTDAHRSTFTSARILEAMFANSALSTAYLLAAISGLCSGLAWWFSMSGDGISRFGIARPAIVWIVVIGLSFVLFGLVPAHFLSTAARRWANSILIWTAEALLFLAIAYSVMWSLRRRNYRWSLKEMAIAVAACGALFLVLPVFQYFLRPLHENEPDFLPSERGLGRYGMGITLSDWQWAVFQWFLWEGITITALSATFILAVWYAMHGIRKQEPSNGTIRRIYNRAYLSGMLRTIGQSSLVMASILIIIWLWLIPAQLNLVEDAYQVRMNYVRDPAKYYKDLLIRADAEIATAELAK
jgi:hypothetical protein